MRQLAANLRLPRTRATGKQRRAVEDDADARAAVTWVTHFADQMQEEQQRTVGHPWQTRAKTAVEALVVVFVGDLLLHLLPFHTEWRVAFKMRLHTNMSPAPTCLLQSAESLDVGSSKGGKHVFQ